MEGFLEEHEDAYDVSRRIALFDYYHILLAEFGEIPIELHSLKLTIGFQKRFARLSPFWLVGKALSLS